MIYCNIQTNLSLSFFIKKKNRWEKTRRRQDRLDLCEQDKANCMKKNLTWKHPRAYSLNLCMLILEQDFSGA